MIKDLDIFITNHPFISVMIITIGYSFGAGVINGLYRYFMSKKKELGF